MSSLKIFIVKANGLQILSLLEILKEPYPSDIVLGKECYEIFVKAFLEFKKENENLLTHEFFGEVLTRFLESKTDIRLSYEQILCLSQRLHSILRKYDLGERIYPRYPVYLYLKGFYYENKLEGIT
jgi:hypothetical protein